MSRNSTLTTALIVAGIALVLAPMLVPIPTVLVHDTRDSTVAGPDELRQRGYTIVAYENLSERGRELYVETLEHGGRYTVSEGEGAPAFDYSASRGSGAGDGTSRFRAGRIAIERPSDADLPPPDERVDDVRYAVEERRQRANRTGGSAPTAADIRGQSRRYDAMSVRTSKPPLGDPTAIARLVSAALGIVSLGVGGYRRSQPN